MKPCVINNFILSTVNSKRGERKRKYSQSFGHVETLEEKKVLYCNCVYHMPNLSGGHWNKPASQA